VSLHLQHEDLALYLLGRLSEGQVSAVDSHLADCKDCDGRLVEAVRFVSQLGALSSAQTPVEGGRRREPRIATTDPVNAALGSRTPATQTAGPAHTAVFGPAP
jgi:anti-sigma factor RsiW